MKQRIKNQWGQFKKNPMPTLRLAVPLFMLALVLMGAVVPAFAQEVTLDIDTNQMTNDLFRGANIIIAALGAVMFLLAGFKLGGILIRGIVDAIGGIRF